MRRFVVGVQYDGAGFVGFQKQPKGKSVQQALENAIFEVARENVNVIGCGRTDSGVHAIESIAHFDIENQKLSPSNLVGGCNVNLPAGVKILWAKEVGENFHAQKSAKKKTYAYVCYVSKVELPIFAGKAAQILEMPNIEKMRQAANFLVGLHDFSSFCASRSGRENFQRRVFSINIEQRESVVPMLVFEICGNGFLYKMVRNIVGTLLEVGQGRREPGEVEDILKAKDRKRAGRTAAACGLYLKKVEY